ncbi:MAG TPA: nucleotide exchange factor GrpE [Vicinamibacterales bacterium]|nr:nucleotide exchange factor GrpE [Acidobacteriota bacterium]HOC19041.1 nucleotide exchange factor GrpE [Vicinamibacterales bacterium]
MNDDKTNGKEREPVDGPVKVIDRRWWTHGETGAPVEPPRKPTYLEELERQIAEKDQAIQAYASKYRESAAEFDQVRARLRRDLDRDIERARRAVLADFLEIADNLDRALAAAPAGTDEAFVRGVDLVRQLLLARFAAHGVTPMDAEGKRFDPAWHDAVSLMEVADPGQDEVVQAVVKKGYLVGGEVLRPAAVVVGKYAGQGEAPTP